ncbi:adenylate-forming reductase 06235-like [Mangifera indica]|uniref:adenylate-forming reductase 06235-like n=1 Tax=Mangifera indica TaxID=29780 RepID=UPI001CFC31DF|nr:adenylate-forming reductase 06235-like [Mangifera indica]
MEHSKPKNIIRFASCRGVAFELNPYKENPFAIPDPSSRKEQEGKLDWLPWIGTSGSFRRSLSRPSSHFCDLEFEDLEIDGQELYIAEDPEKQDASIVVAAVSAKKPPPKQKDTRLSVILLDQGLFTVYKRLFMVCLTFNVLALTLAATGHFKYAKPKATVFSIGNLLASTLCRSEALLRVVFWLAVKLLGRRWIPLRVKTTVTAFLQSLGGIHSGCGVSSIAWLVYALVLTLKDKENTSPLIITLACLILSLICLSSMVWFFISASITYEPASKTYNSSVTKITKEQEFWFTLAITIVIIIPWLTVRRVPVNASSPSGHASIIKFEGGIQAGLLARISPSPLSEWHAFGIISDGMKEHIVLAGAVGDFTKSMVSNPPSHLWVRMHFAGLPYLINMYQRVQVVATGSGICVFLSFLLQSNSADEIKQMVEGYPKDKAIIHDTAILGRPNVAEMSVNAAKNWKAEVVIVTSNPEGSRDIVNACKGAGIPAFGPIWDS